MQQQINSIILITLSVISATAMFIILVLVLSKCDCKDDTIIKPTNPHDQL